MPDYDYDPLNPGLAIYKQKRSNNWYIRMRVKDDSGSAFEYRKSTGTPDKAEATQKAWA